jgi:hypothetical protein
MRILTRAAIVAGLLGGASCWSGGTTPPTAPLGNVTGDDEVPHVIITGTSRRPKVSPAQITVLEGEHLDFTINGNSFVKCSLSWAIRHVSGEIIPRGIPADTGTRTVSILLETPHDFEWKTYVVECDDGFVGSGRVSGKVLIE